MEVPATMAMVRRTAPERLHELDGWARALCATAERFPGHQGHTIVPLRTDESGGYVAIGVRFATAADLAAWETSSEREQALRAGESITQGTPEPVPLEVLTGTIWGTVPPRKTRTRAVATIWAALFPPALLLNLVLDHGANAWHVMVRTLLSTLLLVPVVVLVTVPAVERALTAVGRATSRRRSV
jgi:antibiotic biosynthesis monooxygenase (ABM) superfamily enzyme